MSTYVTYAQSRDALARKLGFRSYAHRFTADKMAGEPGKVEEFLMALAEKIQVCIVLMNRYGGG